TPPAVERLLAPWPVSSLLDDGKLFFSFNVVPNLSLSPPHHLPSPQRLFPSSSRHLVGSLLLFCHGARVTKHIPTPLYHLRDSLVCYFFVLFPVFFLRIVF